MSDGSSGGGWFGRGFVPGAFKPPADSGPSGSFDVYLRGRFYLKPDEQRKVLFCDNLEEGYRLVEHTYIWDPVENRPWFSPCCKHYAKPCDCWLCTKEAPTQRVLVCTVIDRDGYVARKGPNAGKHMKNLKRLFVIPEKVLGLFVRKSKQVEGGGLKLWEFDAYRSNDRTSRLGDDWTPVRKVTEEELKREKIDFKPFDYEKTIPLDTTAAKQEQFFKDHPKATWKRDEQEPEGAPSAAPGTVDEPSGGEDDIPF